MTREELALAIVEELDREYPALLHPYDPTREWDPADAGDAVDLITRIASRYSREIWLKGGYQFELKRERQ